MTINKNKFYVTTPIYYVTAKPHLGSLYSTILADVACRWNKVLGKETFFLTGTDEHGQKIAQAAQRANKLPQDFVDSFIASYKSMWKDYEIDYSYFVRTTDKAHVKAVQAWLEKLQSTGDIYKAFYSGFYCTPCETYLTDKEIEDDKNSSPACTSCARPTNYIAEESYFFRLSKYQDRLLKFYEENPDFIAPRERLNEVIKFVQAGLKDLSISRTTITWGIPFPNDTKHITYVWADALNNYITAIGYGDKTREQEFNFWWPADLQVMGKDIVRFHAIYWPAFLMASSLELPKKLLVHGWIKVNNQKMSKSFGNVVDPEDLLNIYGAEQVRYYLIRHMAITQDSEFSTSDLEQRINSDLANDLGNLLNRVVSLAQKRALVKIEPKNWESKELELQEVFLAMLKQYNSDMDEGYYSRALSHLWKFINDVNAYFHGKEPWKIKDQDEFEKVISLTCHSLYNIAILAWPVMPKKMELLLSSLGVKFELNKDLIIELSKSTWDKTFMLNKIENLFEKIETKIIEEKVQEKVSSSDFENVNINDFAKNALLVGTIESCEEIPKSDKLYKLMVNFGVHGLRQILSGIRKSFLPEDLINKQAIFIFNLEPRQMMGYESQGMLLTAADENNRLSLVTVQHAVPNGTRLK